MKKKLLCIILFSSVILSAQTIIVDEKMDDQNSSGYFQYLPKSKKMMIYKYGSSKTSKGQTAFCVDAEGAKTFLYENDTRRYCYFTRTENSFFTADAKDDGWQPNYSFVQNGKDYLVTKDKLENINFRYFGTYNYNNALIASPTLGTRQFTGSCNDLYIFGFTNPKNSWRVNFEKEDLYLEIIEIQTNSRKRVNLEKPDIALLKGDSFAKSDFDLNFTSKLSENDNNTFDLITKSLSKDSQTTILYKTTYDFEGKKIKVLPFTLKLENKFFITSNNGGGPKYDTSTTSMQSSNFVDESYILDVLSINNYFEDRTNGDLYIYGLFSEEAPKKINARIQSKGFYVFKFDKEGNKLWESVNYIDGKEYFEKISESSGFQLSLLEYNKDLIFSASINAFTEFTNAAVINKATGSIIKSSFIEYNNNLSHGKISGFISNTYDYKELRNKTFSPISFAAMGVNSNVMAYLKNIPEGKERLYFETVFSDQGIWLVETDNKTYDKITLFKE